MKNEIEKIKVDEIEKIKVEKTIFGTIKILEYLLEMAENNNGIIEVTDVLLKDLIENTKQEYSILLNLNK